MERPGSIDPQDLEDILPLTPIQESMLFQYLKESKSKLYFEQNCYELTGDIKIEKIKKAWNLVAETNEALRMVFRWQKLRKAVQIILKNHEIPIQEFDLSSLQGDAMRKRLQSIKKDDVNWKIDLETAPLRIKLCKIGTDKYEMIVSNHHIIMDGWSNVIMLKEFLAAYRSSYSDIEYVKPQKGNYKEYILWQQNRDKTKQKNYWKSMLGGFQFKDSPFRSGNGSNLTGQEKYYEYRVPADLIEMMKHFSKNNGITLAVLFYSAWAILLHNYRHDEDILFGVTVSGRNPHILGIQDMIGLFINTLPLRIEVNPQQTIEDFLKQMNEVLVAMEEFEDTPLIDIISFTGTDPREALFESILVIQNYPVDKSLFQKGAKLNISLTSRFYMTEINLTLGIRIFDHIVFEFAYNSFTFVESEIKNLLRQFIGIIKQIVLKSGPTLPGDPKWKVQDIDMIDRGEKDKFVFGIRENRRKLKEIEGIDFDEIF